MREERRIGCNLPHDPNYLVNTFWDIGLENKNNQNAIWFHQTDGTRHRIIDYYENVGEGSSTMRRRCTKLVRSVALHMANIMVRTTLAIAVGKRR